MKTVKILSLGCEPLSSGYWWRLMLRGCGFESWQVILDGIFFRLICCKLCIVCLKRPKTNEKEAVVGPFFKKILSFVGSISKHLQIKKILNDPKRCWGWSTSKELKGGGCLWTKEQCQVHTLLLPCPFEDSKNCIGFCYIGKSNGIVITSPI